VLLAEQVRDVVRDASRQGRRGREVCGLLASNGYRIDLLPVRNTLRRRGGFQFDEAQVHAYERALRALRHRVVGTFHSHPFSPPEPSRSDITNAFDGDFMLLIGATDRSVRMWHISKGRARRVEPKIV
jgi:proteasome lid subunit RPN8/RPN11